jgi:DNA helicase II / ATP-dependent DNA helicase PcrA
MADRDPRLPPSVSERLAALMADQRAAATAPPGPVLCVAPAGSGKTTTLVARVAWRIALGADPAGVCAVTFNRRAAVELAERLDAALAPLGLAPGTVRVRTFHALGREVLLDAGVDVSAIVERAALIAELAGASAADPLPAAALRYLDDAFSRLMLDPERGPPPSETATHAAFAAYRRALAERGAIDLDDLVAGAVARLGGDHALRERWRARCRVLLIDEAQDLDRAQLELALLLVGPDRDVFLVGDDDQTIYAWRLADVRRVLTLATRLPGLRRVDLVTNHRCPPEVVRRAARLVAHGRERFAKRIEPSPRASGSLSLVADAGDEVARARALLGGWGREPGERAVLARTNAELRPYAAVSLELGLPYRVEDDGLLLDDERVERLLERAAAHPGPALPPLVVIDRAASALGSDPEVRGAVLAWAAGVLAPRWDGSVAQGGATVASGLAGLRAHVAERRAAREALRRDDAPLTLATVHGTKGLEWDHVACVGFDEGVFPSGRSIREAPDPGRALEEERRLAYVAWTRARRSLAIVHDPGAPSLFLREAFDDAELGLAPA